MPLDVTPVPADAPCLAGWLELARRSGAAAWAPADAEAAARRWLEAAGGQRYACEVRHSGSAVGVAAVEEVVSFGHGRAAAVAWLHLGDPPGEPSPAGPVRSSPAGDGGLRDEAASALARRCRERGCLSLEVARDPGAGEDPLPALRRLGFERRPVALFSLELRSLAARLERMRHPALPAGWRLAAPRPQDGEPLLDLVGAFLLAEGGPVPSRDLLRSRLEGERGHDGVVLVVDAAGTAVGMATVAVGAALDGTRQGVLTDYYVVPQHRRRGVGAAVFAEILRRLAAADVDLACGWVAERNAAAQRFWSAHAVRQATEVWALRL